MQQKLEKCEAALQDVTSKYSLSSKRLEEANAKARDVECRYQLVQGSLDNVTTEMHKKSALLRECESSLETCRSQLRSIQERLNDKERECDFIQKSHIELRSEMSNKSVALSECQIALSEANKRMIGQVSGREYHAIETRYKELECTLESMQKTMHALAQKAAYEERFNSSQRDLERIQSRLNETSEKLSVAQKALQGSVPREKFTELQRSFDNLENTLHADFNLKLGNVRFEANQLHQQLRSECSRLSNHLTEKDKVVASLYEHIDQMKRHHQNK